MKFYSTNDHLNIVALKAAVLNSMPPDRGLYMPMELPVLSEGFFAALEELSFHEIAFEMCRPFLTADFSNADIQDIIETAVSFDAPLVPINENISSLELWHGPTLAFKDFGARFMAAVMSRLVAQEDRELHILVATSGDTGGAVASGFLGLENVKVTILYPAGKVSPHQEKQLTTLGQNIKALRVNGTFDDCQRMVKTAFLDLGLNKDFMLASANSINISRLIPQMFYYARAYGQAPQKESLVVAVPSGNFGNLTAGVLAKKMGLPIKRYIAATNANDIVPSFLKTGDYRPRPSVQTISNAMDVGDPSNFTRLQHLFGGNLEKMRGVISGIAFNDDMTREAVARVHDTYGYTLEPHGAIAYLALQSLLGSSEHGILLETAHPAKFMPVMKELVPELAIPQRLAALAKKPSQYTQVESDFNELLSFMRSEY